MDSITDVPGYSALHGALVSGDRARAVQALVVLMRSRTSKDVPAQWRILQEIKEHNPFQGRGQALLVGLRVEFEEGRLMHAVTRRPRLQKEGRAPDDLLWAIRALGAIRSRRAIPVLRELVLRESDFDVIVSSVRALEEIDSAGSRRSLLDFVRRGKWPACAMAATTLGEQAPELLRALVREEEASDAARWWSAAGLLGTASYKEVIQLAEILPKATNPDWEAPLRRHLEIEGTARDVPRLKQLADHLGPQRGAWVRDVLRYLQELQSRPGDRSVK